MRPHSHDLLQPPFLPFWAPGGHPLRDGLNDLILIPLGVIVARRLIPLAVLTECRERARLMAKEGLPISRKAAAIVVAVWLLAAIGTAWLLIQVFGPAR